MITDDELAGIQALSFRDLDEDYGKKQPDLVDNPSAEDDPLIRWYLHIYDKKFGELTDEDINRICIQGWERKYIVPLALLRLQNNPFIGFYYDGSLLLSLASIPELFWDEHPTYREALCEVLSVAISLLQLNEELEPVYMERFPEVYISEETAKEIYNFQKKLGIF